MEPLKFDISLTVLNHLGRNLYRSFATVLGEAISNAWDAEAENVRILYDPEKRHMCIIDDGFGMSRDDFQKRFLNIGYSKRDEFGAQSPGKKRNHIGRKGIGKLALLSCADQVVVLSKKVGGEWSGVIIDNHQIDEEIKKGSGAAHYELQEPDIKDYSELCTGESGTVICFNGLKEDRNHSEEYLRKVIALYFRFSLIDPEFRIFLNEKEVTIEALGELAASTQFVWNINNYHADPYLELLHTAAPAVPLTTESAEITGFIASVKKPTNRNIFGAKERIGVDLLVNGRMRELDLLKHFPSSQLPEEYLYGQIHINTLDSDVNIDRFTSSREGVQADDPIYKKYLGEIKSLVAKIMDQWDDLREQHGDDGDPENTKREPSRIKKGKSLFREVAKDYADGAGDGGGDEFIKDLAGDAAFNSSSYVQCFISENLLRRHIENSGTTPTACCNLDPSGQTCSDRHPGTGSLGLCGFCKGQRGIQTLQQQKADASTAIPVRAEEGNLLMYLDYIDLASIINNKILRNEDKLYKPLRNSVMHTSRLTEEAKTRLTAVFHNVVATVKSLTGGGTTGVV